MHQGIALSNNNNNKRHGVICVMPVVNYLSLDTISTHMVVGFSVAGPAAWNCLCDELHEPLLTVNSFRQLPKTRLFAEYYCIQRIRGIAHYALYKAIYLLTYRTTTDPHPAPASVTLNAELSWISWIGADAVQWSRHVSPHMGEYAVKCGVQSAWTQG